MYKGSMLKNSGTTLVEALVAVLILSIGIIPSLGIILVSQNLSSAIKNNLIAANLAQEGVEVVRALRDNNWFNGNIFDTGLADGIYLVEWNSTSLVALSGDNPPLKKDTNGLYNYTTGTDSSFRRRIIITKDPTVPGCNCELLITSEVTWPERTRMRTVNVESHLYNWR